MRRLLAALVLSAALAAPLYGQTDQERRAPSAELLAKVPDDLREPVAKWFRLTAKYEAQLLQADADDLRFELVVGLANHVPEARDFVLQKLPDESRRTKTTILANMGADIGSGWSSQPRAVPTIEHLIANDPDVKVVDAALDSLAKSRLRPIKDLLDKRIDAEFKREGRSAVAALEERWVSIERGVMLPRFLQDPPPVFAATSPKDSVRWVAFGDFGSGADSQLRTAAAVVAEHGRRPYDFGITLGDNFYGSGMTSPGDPRWKSQWEDLYSGMGIPFYACLGNHDWYGTDSPAAEILYSARSPSWRMPATYYTYTAGPVQFFVLDGDVLSHKQLAWLDTELAKSKMTWRVVYGHYPIYSATLARSTGLIASNMKPVYELLVKHRVDLYIAGHHHSLQHLKPRDGIELVISGGGGKSTYSVPPNHPDALFGTAQFGFTVFEADRGQMSFRHLDWDGRELYRYSFRKKSAAVLAPASSGFLVSTVMDRASRDHRACKLDRLRQPHDCVVRAALGT